MYGRLVGLQKRRDILLFHSAFMLALTGSKDDNGLGCRCFCTLKCVKAINPPKEMKKPRTPMVVIVILKNIDVTMMAKIRRIQFKAAW